MKATYWIQHADFNSEKFEAVDIEAAKKALFDKNWIKEEELFNQLQADKKESCPPGIGFTIQDIGILHVCPESESSFLVHFHDKRPIRFLGFISLKRNRLYSRLKMKQENILAILENFFKGKIQLVIQSLTPEL